VLDVAGGKGDIAFELLNLNDIPATLVEPRPRCLHKRLLWLQVSCASPFPWSCRALASLAPCIWGMSGAACNASADASQLEAASLAGV
jgi:hypothetical protein